VEGELRVIIASYTYSEWVVGHHRMEEEEAISSFLPWHVLTVVVVVLPLEVEGLYTAGTW